MSYLELLTYANQIMWGCLVVCAILFALSGSDDFFIDIVYWSNYFWHKLKRGKKTNLSYEDLVSAAETRIAIMVPCWHESEVIGSMLQHNIAAINYQQYDFFVGVYPNDPETIEAIKKVQQQHANIHCVISALPGPTTKASNLNSVYQYIAEHEKKQHLNYDIFLMHDSEDIIHPLELKLCNYLLSNHHYEMLQTPVLPLEVSLKHFTHWIYNDEFSELHTKDLHVRGMINSFIPSAGVGTAFSRNAIEKLKNHNGGLPFIPNRLTEDYDTSMRLRELDQKTAFYAYNIERIKYVKKYLLFGKQIPRKAYEFIATRSLFQFHYQDALRQRARWIQGIALQEWFEHGWRGKLSVRFVLLHDRKTIATNLISGFAYIIFIYWILNLIIYPGPSVLNQFLNVYPLVWVLIIYCSILMVNRNFQRFIATNRVYGLLPALLSIPRVLYGNILNTHTTIIAIRNYIRVATGRKPLSWSKSKNVFPTEKQMSIYKSKLGELLLDKKLVTAKQMIVALQEQKESKNKKLGEILLKNKMINSIQLTNALAAQFSLEIVSKSDYRKLTHDQLPKLSSENYAWLLTNEFLPIRISNDLLTIGINNPHQLENKAAVSAKLLPYQSKFVLFSLTPRIGDILIKEGIITQDQLAEAIAEQAISKQKLGTILLTKNYLDPVSLTKVFARQFNLEVVDTTKYPTLKRNDLPKLSYTSFKWLIQNEYLPISLWRNEITLMVKEPVEEQVRNEIVSRIFPYEIRFVLSYY